MGLRDQNRERGYAMAALLVALAIMAILLTVAMPVWRHEARREREAELVFRGEQYARAIALFRHKNSSIANAFPPSIDALVQGRFLRKKYKDPMTKDGEFELIGVGSQQPGINPTVPPPPGGGRGPIPPSTSQVAGGMMGVRSKSTETSIRSYRGGTRYDQWAFTFNVALRPGGAMPMANTPDGGRGGPNFDGRGGFGGRDGRGGFGGRDGRGNTGGRDGRGGGTGAPRGGGPGGSRGGPVGRGGL
jgi:type II secretory pathway pseudopilin PulG